MDELEQQILRDGIRAQDQFIAEQNAALRKLVAWLRDENKDGVPTGVQDAADAFDFTAGLLEEVLGNATVVARRVDPETGLDL